MVIRYFGREGLVKRIREHIRLGQLFASWVEDDPDFQRLAPTPFSTICFRAFPADLAFQQASAEPTEAQNIEDYLEKLNETVIDSINATGEIFMAPTRLRGHFTLRLAIGNIRTDERIVTRTWDLLQQLAKENDAILRNQYLGG